jgi:hypothetical protein
METLEPFSITADGYAEFVEVQGAVFIAQCGGPKISAANKQYMLALFEKLHAVSPFSPGVVAAASAVRERP